MEEIVYNYFSQDYALITRKEKAFDPGHGRMMINGDLYYMAMDQYLLIPFLMGWTSMNPSYFDVHQGYKVLTHCHIIIYPVVRRYESRPPTSPNNVWDETQKTQKSSG